MIHPFRTPLYGCIVRQASIFKFNSGVIPRPAKFSFQQVAPLRLTFLDSIHEKQPAMISSMVTEPGELLQIFPELVPRPHAGFYLHTRQISFHVARPVNEQVWFGVRIGSLAKQGVSPFVNLAAKAEIESVPDRTQLVVKLIAKFITVTPIRRLKASRVSHDPTVPHWFTRLIDNPVSIKTFAFVDDCDH
jgi:hypothetical protein